MIQVDAQTMREIAPHFSGENGERQSAIINAVGAVLTPTLEVFKINTRLRIAHFLGQTCHESAGFRTTEEFASGDAYEFREDLGNTSPGDGKKYKGRGLLQLTGKANYIRYGGLLKLPLVDEPHLAADPVVSLRIACLYWTDRNINDPCDDDDLLEVTRRVNGGTRGLAERGAFTSKAKTAIVRLEGFHVAGAQPVVPGRPVLRRGSAGDAVAGLQALLRKIRFTVAVDGEFGPATETAVTRFQSEHSLQADGIVGAQTWQALDEASR